MIKSHAFEPVWKGKGMSASGSSVMVRTKKGRHVFMHLFTRWQSRAHWMFHSQSYSLHCHRAFLTGQDLWTQWYEEKNNSAFVNRLAESLLRHHWGSNKTFIQLCAVEPVCKMKVHDWVFGETRTNANADFWRQGAVDLLAGSVG